ncbi:MAG: carboxypeptidase regulatory-like domain-containing protein [Deltaproteobacteria bacterium]|nr:MAG: carboxypeptidase regulatory-like domain-containing protein [Deltaproteobacteria bacterium]
MRPLLLLALIACTGSSPETRDPVDLTEMLDEQSARAGLIVDEASLFGGISAEGRVGDYLLYNDRVRFVIQSDREGSYYVGSGGGVIDADIVRPEGVPGRDAVDEWAGMVGFGRLIDPEAYFVEVDGADGGAASLLVVGQEGELELAEGALEAPDLIQHDDLLLQVRYRLAPGSWLMEVETTVRNPGDDAVSVAPGDIIMGSLEAMETYEPGTGLDGVSSGGRLYSGLMGLRNQVAVALFPPPGGELDSGALGLIAEIADASAGQGEPLDIPAGGTATYTRYYGVGPDLATLTDAWLALDGRATQTVDGQVTAPDGPVAGARVHILVDGEPFTVAVTDADGRFAALAPTGTATTFVDGRGRGMFFDLPEGAPGISAYGADIPAAQALTALAEGAPGPAFAQGRGTSTDLTLAQPGQVHIAATDGGPFEARLRATASAGPADDRRLLRGEPDGGSVGWGVDDLTLDVLPGEYTVLVHRGLRHELHQETITVVAGQTVEVSADLGAAIDHGGYLLGDPHIHASPSSDAAVPMEERILGAAGVGLQLHFGTDHDHVADYAPIIGAAGLSDRLASVVATEWSPPTRGHMNLYPLVHTDGANGGAVPWWRNFEVSTAEMVQRLRDHHGEFVLQLNHPLDSGMFQFAEWEPGLISDAERYTSDFDAMELMNAGSYDEYLPLYLDLVSRGVKVVPTGVSDSHGHLNSMFGLSATWLGFGSDQVSAYSPDALMEVYGRGDTIVTRGPFLALSEKPGSTLTPGTTLDVEARSPSWIGVDRLILYENGLPLETVTATTASFTLSPDADAVYHVVAEGDAPMSPLSSRTPWAMTGSFYVDVGGDGWTPPLDPLVIQP